MFNGEWLRHILLIHSQCVSQSICSTAHRSPRFLQSTFSPIGIFISKIKRTATECVPAVHSAHSRIGTARTAPLSPTTSNIRASGVPDRLSPFIPSNSQPVILLLYQHARLLLRSTDLVYVCHGPYMRQPALHGTGQHAGVRFRGIAARCFCFEVLGFYSKVRTTSHSRQFFPSRVVHLNLS